jgi:hypothetical protein
VIDAEVSISRLAWDVARQRHGIEQQHHVLHILTPRVSSDDDPAIERRALDELSGLGLAARGTVSPPDALAPAIVRLLLAQPAGRGRSVTVPVDAYLAVIETGGGRTAYAEGSILQSNQAPDQVTSDCRAMQRVLSQSRHGGGQVYAAARTAFGQRRKTQYPIAYVDLESGRWLTKQQANGGRSVWVVLAPASPELLINELNGLLNTVIS